MQRLDRRLPSIFAKHMNPNDVTHQRVLLCLQTLWRIGEIYKANRTCNRFPSPAAKELVELSFQVNQCVTYLVRYFHGRRSQRLLLGPSDAPVGLRLAEGGRRRSRGHGLFQETRRGPEDLAAVVGTGRVRRLRRRCFSL